MTRSDSRGLRVLAVVPSVYDTSPGQRYRIEQWEPYLREVGVEIEWAPYETSSLNSVIYRAGHLPSKVAGVAASTLRRFRDPVRAKRFDLVYLFREACLVGPAFFERLIAWTGVPIVFDFDDAIFLPNVSQSNRAFRWLKSAKKTSSICRMSAHVMVGNSMLAEYARARNPNVTVIPTTIDTNEYRLLPERGDPETPVIGWTGSGSTAIYLELVRGALRRLAEKRRFRFRVIGAEFKDSRVDVELVKWQSATEVHDLEAVDVGLMPLPDDEWARGKCALKALQYMGLGIPTVSSPVGVNAEIFRHGENGFLARTEDEWVSVLDTLLTDRQLRRRVGVQGHATLQATFAASVQAPRVAEIFRSVARP